MSFVQQSSPMSSPCRGLASCNNSPEHSWSQAVLFTFIPKEEICLTSAFEALQRSTPFKHIISCHLYYSLYSEYRRSLRLHSPGSVNCINIIITAANILGHFPCAESFAGSILPQASGVVSGISPCI